MVLDLVLAICHHLAVFVVFAVLVMEFALLKLPLTERAVQFIAKVDLGYGIAAAVVVTAGLVRVFQGARGAAFYSHNPVFWVKMGLFVVIGLISIAPTLRFIAWRKTSELPEAADVVRVQRLVTLELGLFMGVPVLAAMMARGVGL
jgi:putative membrane protein